MNLFKKLKLKRRYYKELNGIYQQYLEDCNSFACSLIVHRHDNDGKNYKTFDECCDISNKRAREIYLIRKEEIDNKYVFSLGLSKEELAKWISQKRR